MPTRDQIAALLDAGHSFLTAGRALDIPAGQAYMIATGRPADGSDTPHANELHDKLPRPGSSQDLVNPPPFTPTRDAQVIAWVQHRAARELTESE